MRRSSEERRGKNVIRKRRNMNRFNVANNFSDRRWSNGRWNGERG